MIGFSWEINCEVCQSFWSSDICSISVVNCFAGWIAIFNIPFWTLQVVLHTAISIHWGQDTGTRIQQMSVMSHWKTIGLPAFNSTKYTFQNILPFLWKKKKQYKKNLYHVSTFKMQKQMCFSVTIFQLLLMLL